MSINLSISFSHPGATSHQVSYARIDNTATPIFTTIVPNIAGASGTFRIAENIPDGQYEIHSLPIYPDGRVCQPEVSITPACPGLISINAYITGNVIVVTYLAPSTVPKVRVNISYPNGGSFVANYVNDGNPISVGLPANVFGIYTVYGQSVCDETSGFYSPLSSSVSVSNGQPISGSFQLGNTTDAACAAVSSTLYTSGSPVPGSTVFFDAALSNPVTGYNYIIYAGVVYNLDPLSGVIGSNTGVSCSGSNRVIVYNNLTTSTGSISTISGLSGYVLPTALAPGNDNFGTHIPFTGAISVTVSGLGGLGTLCLYKNNVLTSSINTTGPSTYSFPSDTYLSNDAITIIWNNTGC